jgi:Tol biopolymer transport system component
MASNSLKLVTLLLVLIAAAPPVASASFPGANGALVLAVEGCDRYHRHLVKMPWRGGAFTELTDPCQHATQEGAVDLDVYAPDASADGQRIVAQGEETDYSPVSGPRHFFFTTISADGGDERRVALPDGVVYPGGPSFAPSGARFAFHDDPFSGGTAIWAARTDGSGAEAIRSKPTCGPPDRSKNCTAFLDPRWSPDGKLIAVEVESRRYSVRAPVPVRPGIWLMRARDGKLVRRLAKHGGWVDWSPDGRRLVYGTRYRQKGGGGASGGNLYVVDRRGGRSRVLVHREDVAETEPTWSPDGRWVAFVSMRMGTGDVGYRVDASLWRVRASGGKPIHVRDIPDPDVEEGNFNAPGLTWLPRPR